VSNVYGGLIAAAMTPIAIGAYWWFRSRRQSAGLQRLAITVTASVMIGAGIISVWSTSLTSFVDRDVFVVERSDLFLHSAKWWSYLVPPVSHPVAGAFVERAWASAGVGVGLLEHQVALGWGVVALGAVAAGAWWRTRQAPPPALAAVPILLSVAGVALVCSLSPERSVGPFTVVRPSAVLYEIAPMFRAYARFGVVVQLMAALLAGIGAEWLWRSGTGRAKRVCVALVMLAAAEYAVWPPALWRDVLPTPAHRWIAQLPGHVRALECVPLTATALSTEWLTRERITVLHDALDDCAEPNLLSRLSAAGYTHVLVHPDPAAGRFASEDAQGGLRHVAEFDGSRVYAITAAAPSVYTAAMTSFYPREAAGGWTWRWMAGEAAWTVVNDSGRTLTASVEIEMSAFHRPRGLTVTVDGELVQTLVVDQRRRPHRIGPLPLRPGRHQLEFRAIDRVSVPHALIANGDPRPLSIRFGGWRWVVESERP
jgi:hypothetical protein